MVNRGQLGGFVLILMELNGSVVGSTITFKYVLFNGTVVRSKTQKVTSLHHHNNGSVSFSKEGTRYPFDAVLEEIKD